MSHPQFKIKAADWSGGTGDYAGVPVDLTDPRASDPLVKLSDFAIANESYYARADGANTPYGAPMPGALKNVWCRKLVAEKLVRVNEALAPHGAELSVVDGYRSLETQRALWDFYAARVAREMPDADAAQQRTQVRRYVSDPSRFERGDPSTWPSHATGGAIDLTLRARGGAHLDMGATFDDMRPISHSDALERALASGAIGPDDPALNHRRLLHWAMENEGFVNYPLEFWHFDWGDQMYVHNLAQSGGAAPRAAWYGYVDPPADE